MEHYMEGIILESMRYKVHSRDAYIQIWHYMLQNSMLETSQSILQRKTNNDVQSTTMGYSS